MEGFATVEEALEELRNGKLILVTETRIAKMRAILYVPRNLPQRKTSILWQCMEKG